MKRTLFILLMLLPLAAQAQNYVPAYGAKDTVVFYNAAGVGVPKNGMNRNAAFQVNSTNRGAMLPRMTTTQRNAILVDAADEGLEIWNLTTHTKNVYNGTAWTEIVTTP